MSQIDRRTVHITDSKNGKTTRIETLETNAPTADEARRQAALQLAINARASVWKDGGTAQDMIATAVAFEAYLREGDTRA